MTRRRVLDLLAIREAVAKDKAARAVIAAAEAMRDLRTEARILAAMIADGGRFDRGVLALTESFETLDFFDYRHQAAFGSMRDLHASGHAATVCDIADDIAMSDLTHGKNISEFVHPAFLGSLLLTAMPYFGDEEAITEDVARLRALSQQRQSA